MAKEVKISEWNRKYQKRDGKEEVKRSDVLINSIAEEEFSNRMISYTGMDDRGGDYFAKETLHARKDYDC